MYDYIAYYEDDPMEFPITELMDIKLEDVAQLMKKSKAVVQDRFDRNGKVKIKDIIIERFRKEGYDEIQ